MSSVGRSNRINNMAYFLFNKQKKIEMYIINKCVNKVDLEINNNDDYNEKYFEKLINEVRLNDMDIFCIIL